MSTAQTPIRFRLHPSPSHPIPFANTSFLALPQPVPFEALIPFGLLTVMFAATGTLFSAARRITNDGKPTRHTLDTWENNMMERDRRLTGSLRGQSTEPIAPKSFATNSVWETEKVQKTFL